jgi:hypothetical protein
MEPNYRLLKNPPVGVGPNIKADGKRLIFRQADRPFPFLLVFLTVYGGGKSWSSVNHSTISSLIRPVTECRAVSPLLSLYFAFWCTQQIIFLCFMGILFKTLKQ